ncbi:MAG: hypothetical protein Q3971_08660 [Moraxella sp.]|nr:hypothetical protein [Moraxella sp.]
MYRLSLIAFASIFLVTGCASKTKKSQVSVAPSMPSNPTKVGYSTAHTPKISPTHTNKTFDTNWVRYPFHHDEFTYYYDSSSIKYVGYPAKIKVWRKIVFHTPKSYSNGDKYDTIVDIAHYDCSHKKMAYEAKASYYLDKPVWSDTRSTITDNHPIVWEYALPDTIGMIMLAHICSNFGLRP